MESPAVVNFGADRFVPFIRTLAFVDYDFTGATYALQVRSRKDGGTLYANLATVTTTAEGVRLLYAGTDTVANHVLAGRMTQAQADALGYESATSVTLSQLSIRINETTMEAMPFGDVRGDDELLYWDLHITLGGTKEKYAGGDFLVRAGVTE